MYEKYNKNNFEKFCSCVENLLILENFLIKSSQLLGTAVSNSKIQQNQSFKESEEMK